MRTTHTARGDAPGTRSTALRVERRSRRPLAPPPLAPISTAPRRLPAAESPHAGRPSAPGTGRLPFSEMPIWMAYQPIVSWPRGEVIAHEALLRSRVHPAACPPGHFGSARQLGIAGRLGRRVRQSVAGSLARLPGGTSVFVNIEREELVSGALLAPDDPLRPIASRIVLELTEGGTPADAVDLEPHLAPLRALGYRLALDDLGAGCNGLSAFADAHFDVAKIDMSLVRGIATSTTKQRVVRFLYELCADSQVDCVTEGVEREDELETLVRLGGELFQGYLFGRPRQVLATRALGAG